MADFPSVPAPLTSGIVEYPRFLTLEGVEGAGKSTAVAVIRDELIARGLEVVTTREPGGTPMAERIRSCMLDQTTEVVLPETELLLMFAARMQHVHHVILPALNRGAYVVCDRFTCSSYAYQGAGRGVDERIIRELEQSMVRIAPSLSLFVDVDPIVGLERARRRSGNADRIECERVEFFERARKGFVARVREHPARYRRIDGGNEITAVERDVRAAIAQWLGDQRNEGSHLCAQDDRP